MDLASLQPSTFASRVTDLPVTAVWAVASDPLLLPALSTELQAVRVLGRGPVVLGSRFEGDQLRGERRWTTTSTVTALEAPARFEWTVGDLERPVSRWSFHVDHEAGATTLSHKVVLCGGPSPLTEFVGQHPESAEEVIQERLQTLRDRMVVTIDGLLAIARTSVGPH